MCFIGFAKWFWEKKEETVLFTRLYALFNAIRKNDESVQEGNLPSTTSSTQNMETINAATDVSNDVPVDSEQSTEMSRLMDQFLHHLN